MAREVSTGLITQNLINHVKEFELHQHFIQWSVPLKDVSQGMT